MATITRIAGRTAGGIVRDARRKVGLSIAGLGSRLGLSTAFVSEVERGQRALTFERWGELFAALPKIDRRRFATAALGAQVVRIDVRSLERVERAAIAEILASAATRRRGRKAPAAVPHRAARRRGPSSSRRQEDARRSTQP